MSSRRSYSTTSTDDGVEIRPGRRAANLRVEASSDKLTCTRCGVIYHAVTQFTPEERCSVAPTCRRCLLNHKDQNHSSSSSRQQRGKVLSKRQQLREQNQQREKERALQEQREEQQRQYQQDFEEQAKLKPSSSSSPSNRSNTSSSNAKEEKKEPDEADARSRPKQDPEPTKKESTTQQKQPKKKQTKMEKVKQSYDNQKAYDPTEKMYRKLVESLLDPSRSWGVPNHLRDKRALYEFVRKVLDVHNDKIAWLVKPLIDGLTEDVVIPAPQHPEQQQHPSQPVVLPNAKINIRVAFGKSSTVFYSLLAWTCHFRYLHQACGWQGQDDIVNMVLAAPGIHVNDLFFNKTHAGFFAVLYGTPHTLELLSQSGIDLQQVDAQGRSMLYHALEYPNAAMLRKVLNYIHDEKDEHFQTSAMHLLRIGAMALQQEHASTPELAVPACWRMLGGPPTLPEIAESLMVVRQRGAKLVPSRTKERDDLTMILKSFKPFSDEPFVQSLTGQWLPPAVQKRVDVRDADAAREKDQDKREAVELCTIHELDTSKQTTTLACGHLFCQECTVGYNENNQGRPLCPVCSRRLGLEILQYFGSSTLGQGTGNIRHDLEHEQLKSLSILSNSQLGVEAKAQGCYSSFYSWSFLREKFMGQVIEAHLQQAPQVSGGMSAVLNTSATHTHIVTGEHGVTVAPAHGPVCFEVLLKGVPLLAHLNNTARWTMVSSTLVEHFNLPRLPHLTTITADGIEVSHLQEITFDLGSNVQVTLDNAVEVPADDMRGMGLQLGLDFLLSATYCCVDLLVRLERETVPMRCDGLHSWIIHNISDADYKQIVGRDFECLRYHARNGQMVRLPLLHWNVNSSSSEMVDLEVLLSLDYTAQMEQDDCHWCGRICGFGKMVGCEECRAVCYCDEHCQTAAHTIHKFTCGQHPAAADQ